MTTNDRIPGTTIEEKEQYILSKAPLLSLSGYSLTENDDCLEDFIHNLLAVYNRNFETINAATKAKHTRIGAHRSLVDIFCICKYYFPSCTLKEVIKGLYILGNETICSQICSTIYRRVYELRVTQSQLWRNHLTDRDEFGYTEENYLTILNN